MAREGIPGTVPVVECGRKLLALHSLKTSKGEQRFAISEVVPSKMAGRQVEEWTTVYQGVSIWFETPVETEDFFRKGLVALDSLKSKPVQERLEKPLPGASE